MQFGQSERGAIISNTRKTAYHCTNRMLRSRGCFLYRIVDNEVQKEIITAKCAADFSAALKMDKQLLVHKLNRYISIL